MPAHRYPDLYPAPEVQRGRRHGGAHVAGEMVLIAITILLAVAVWKFVVGYMAWGSSAPAAAIQYVGLQGGVLTATVQNIGSVPIRNVSLVYLDGPLPRPIPLITTILPPGQSAGASVDVSNYATSGPPYSVIFLARFANNATQVIASSVG